MSKNYTTEFILKFSLLKKLPFNHSVSGKGDACN